MALLKFVHDETIDDDLDENIPVEELLCRLETEDSGTDIYVLVSGFLCSQIWAFSNNAMGIGNFRAGQAGAPNEVQYLLLHHGDQHQPYLPCFTSQVRAQNGFARNWKEKPLQKAGLIAMDGETFLSSMRHQPIDVVVNPYSRIKLILTPESVQRIIEEKEWIKANYKVC